MSSTDVTYRTSSFRGAMSRPSYDATCSITASAIRHVTAAKIENVADGVGSQARE